MVVFSAVDVALVFCLFRFLNQLGWAINQTNATATLGTSCKGNEGINHANLITLKLRQNGRLRADSPHCGEQQVTRFAEKGTGIGCIAAKDDSLSRRLIEEKFTVTYHDILSICSKCWRLQSL